MSDESVQVQEMAGALERKVQAVYERNAELDTENQSLKISNEMLEKECERLRERNAALAREVAARIRYTAIVDAEIDQIVAQAVRLKKAKDGQRPTAAPAPQAQPEHRPQVFPTRPALRPVDTTASSADILRRIAEGQ